MSETADRPAPRRDLAASPRLFRNPILDKLSRVHPSIPPAIYLPLVAVLLWLASNRLGVAAIMAALFCGYILWTLFEYFAHREIFHLVPPGALGARLHFLIHGVHHDYPSDPLRLVMPPLVSMPVAAIVLLLLRLSLGRDVALPVGAGFALGYVAYDMLHFHLHHGRARWRWERALRRRHMAHHFRDATRGFGISCPWWDDLLGTGPRPHGE